MPIANYYAAGISLLLSAAIIIYHRRKRRKEKEKVGFPFSSLKTHKARLRLLTSVAVGTGETTARFLELYSLFLAVAVSYTHRLRLGALDTRYNRPSQH